MDKLKEQLAPVLKHGFWIMTGLVMIGSLAIWWLASGKLISEFETAQSRIESDAQRVTSVSSKLTEHPNPKTHAEMEKLIKDREQEVLDAWESVYKRQQEILVWPASLQEDFVSEFRDLIPIELKVQFPTPEEEEKESTLLNRYRYYIGAVLPGIAEIAKTKWTASFDRSGGGMSGDYGGGGDYGGDYGGDMGYGGGAAPDDGTLVQWDTGSQEALMSDLFPWRGGQPSTLNVLYSQENLWILRQLMQIIANVNGDAGQRFQAKIHNINRIAIGSSVKTTAGNISKPSSDLAGGMMGGEDYMGGDEDYSGGDDMGAYDDSMGDGMEGAMGATLDPGDNRYVDPSGKPLLASTLRAALESKQPENAFMAVAKRIPVMMSLKMDQKAIPDLIAKCGSAALMVEVSQVRILPTGNTGAGGGGDYGGGGYGGDDYGGGEDGMDDGGMGMGGQMMGGATGAKEQFPMDLDVEIYGLIYIYNPPQAENLGVENVTEETVIDGQSVLDGRKVETDTPPAVAPPAVVPPVAGEPIAPAAVEEATPGDAPQESLPVPSTPVPSTPVPAAADPSAPVPAAANGGPEASQPPLAPGGVPPANGAQWSPGKHWSPENYRSRGMNGPSEDWSINVHECFA